MGMFCYQCEQTAGGTGCTKIGVCGKNEDVAALQDTLIFGLFSTLTNVNFNLARHIDLVLKCGEMNLRVMELLDKAHIDRFGQPAPAQVFTGLRKGHAILVTGHDFLDLEEILKQSEGKGINVYTHGEMLPAHAYPALKKYPHLVGNYGTAWQNQRQEFEQFPGAIVVTTNCVMPLTANQTYGDRIFTRGVTGIEGSTHIEDRDFSAVIAKALAIPAAEEKDGDYTLTTGFHHNFILSVADKIVDAVKAGKIKRFFLIGGCDGAKPGRNYYTELAQQIPLQPPRLRRHRRHPPPPRHRPVQQRLLRHPGRRRPRPGIQMRRQRPAAHPRPLLVRTKSRRHLAHPPPPRRQKHPRRSHRPGLHHPRRLQSPQ